MRIYIEHSEPVQQSSRGAIFRLWSQQHCHRTLVLTLFFQVSIILLIYLYIFQKLILR